MITQFTLKVTLQYKQTNSTAFVCEPNILTMQPPLVEEVLRIEGVM
jgi:hypothetical protein